MSLDKCPMTSLDPDWAGIGRRSGQLESSGVGVCLGCAWGSLMLRTILICIVFNRSVSIILDARGV
jgi:hypothetical protein